MMARSRSALVVVMSGAFGSCLRLFERHPVSRAHPDAFFTRAIPAANSGASRPLSVASTASLRMANTG